MNNIHPSEKEIQQYALDKMDSNPVIIAHIDSCSDCQAEVSTYQILFSEIKEQPSASFDFDVQELVLSKLPTTKTGLSTDDIIAGFLVIFTCSCIGIPVYVFRKIILNSFIDIPPFFVYSIIIGTTGILITKILYLYKKFIRQMHLLNIN
ncbi:MAG TPA: hypothetical protein VGO21_01225 [Candidatus Paceibacterota bacterium]|nr:hypothetical protein [Candidatus Paceibacterota bacterium]